MKNTKAVFSRPAVQLLTGATAALGVLALAGCPSREISELVPDQATTEHKKIPVNINRNLDLLFVVDNSKSMEQEQASLTANFPGFIEVLNNIEGGLPDVHIGVVSSDAGTLNVTTADTACQGLGDNGALLKGGSANACPQINGNYISSLSNGMGGRTTNITSGTLEQAFTCQASLGVGGCGFEQHLESMKRSFTNAANTGFLRDDAFLGIVIIADEDDCSMKTAGFFDGSNASLGPFTSFRCFEYGVECEGDNDPRAEGSRSNCRSREDSAYASTVASFVEAVIAEKGGDTEKIVVAGIIGDSSPVSVGRRTTTQGDIVPDLSASCTYTSGGVTNLAAPGVRLQQFLQSFPNHAVETICQGDLSGALVNIANLLKEAIGNPCITGNLLDKDAATAGVQPDGSCSYIRNLNKENQTEQILPECNDGQTNQPCWTLTENLVNCADTPSHLEIEVIEASQPTDVTLVCDFAVTNGSDA